jgi:hypothetical protein
LHLKVVKKPSELSSGSQLPELAVVETALAGPSAVETAVAGPSPEAPSQQLSHLTPLRVAIADAGAQVMIGNQTAVADAGAQNNTSNGDDKGKGDDMGNQTAVADAGAQNNTSNGDDKGKGDDMGTAKSNGKDTGKGRNKYKTLMRRFHYSDMISDTIMVDWLSMPSETGKRKAEYALSNVSEPPVIVDAHPGMARERPLLCCTNPMA